MNTSLYKTPLHETAMTTDTDIWNDSCSIAELEYAIENGAVGATTNPVIVGNVLRQEIDLWDHRIQEIIREMSGASEEDIAWKLNEEMAIKGAELLQPVFNREQGKKGRLAIQTNPKFYKNASRMIEQASRFNTLVPNIHVKIPVTRAGVEAIEEATFRGVHITATVCFTVPQAIAVAEAVERGLSRRKIAGGDNTCLVPVCAVMVGRLDDWLKIVAGRENIITNPDYLEWAGVAVFKKAYRIYKERGYQTRLLAAAYRNHYHWSEFIGGDVILTIPYIWQKRFNSSDIKVIPRMQTPVNEKILEDLLGKFEDFCKAYDSEGMIPEEFDSYGATVRTLRSFLAGYDTLLRMVREYMLPNPD